MSNDPTSTVPLPGPEILGEAYISALQDTALAYSRQTPLGERLRSVLLHAQSALGAGHGFLYLLEADGRTMRMRVGTGLFERFVGIHCEPKQGLAGRIWDSRQPVMVNDYAAWSGRGIDIQADGATALLGVPVRSGGTVIGVMGLAHAAGTARFDDAGLHRVSGFVELISIVLHADQVQQGAREQAARRETIEAELRRHQHEGQQILDLVPAAVWVKDRENRILRANRAAALLLGHPAASLEGQHLWEIDPENALQSYRADLEVIESGRPRHGSIEERRTAEGRRQFWQVDRVPYGDGETGIDGVIVYAQDVTDQQLSQTRTQAERLAAEAANRVKSRYLSTMSRQIRGPMSGVLSAAMRLSNGALDPSQKDAVRTIQELSDAALGVIHDVLDFSRIEAGSLDVEVRDFEPRPLVEDVLDVMSRHAHEKGIELASFVDPNVPWTLAGDPTRLRQVLINLLSNAIRFTDEGEVVVLLKPVLGEGNPHELRLEVRDTGCGIADLDPETLFAPYIHLEEASPDRPGASGLGLAICHRLVSLMGGAMGVESVPDEGSTFWCHLPLQHPLGVGEGAGRPVRPSTGARVLVVEDNATVRGFLQRQLADLQLHADLAESADEALGMMRAATEDGWPYRVALVDRHLGEEGATALLWEMGRDESLAELQTYWLAPFGEPERNRPEGVAGVLTKPVRHADLMGALVEALGPREEDALRSNATEGSHAMEPHLGANVLLVEDDRLEQRLEALGLERLGCRVTVAVSRAEALELVEREDFDLALLSCEIDGESALDLATEIRRREGAERHTPLVAMTTHPSRAQAERCLAAGLDLCLAKPIPPGQLRDLLCRWASLGSLTI